MKSLRTHLSVRFHKETIEDFDRVRRLYGMRNRSQVIRFLVRSGFNSLGSWRKRLKSWET